MRENDEALLAAARRGDIEAYGTLVQRHQRIVRAAVYCELSLADHCDDVAQDAFVLAWSRLEQLRDGQRFGAWVRGIARNLARNARRRRVAGPLDDAVDLRTSTTLEDELAWREEADLVRRAVERLPQSYREVIVSFYFEEQSAAAVAAALELPVNAVEKRLSRGRRLLRDEVERMLERHLAPRRSSAVFLAGVLDRVQALPAVEPSRPARGLAMKSAMSALGLLIGLAAVGVGAVAFAPAETVEHGAVVSVAGAAMSREKAPEPAASLAETWTHRAKHRQAATQDSEHQTQDSENDAPFILTPLSDGFMVSTPEDEELRVNMAEMAALEEQAKELELRLLDEQGKEPPPEKPAPLLEREIRGRVIDETGAPVRGAVVVADTALRVQSALFVDHAVETDEDGSFALPATRGATTLLALHRDGLRSQPVRLPEGTQEHDVELRLAIGVIVRGTVWLDGRPLPGQVRLVEPDRGLTSEIKVEADGSFVSPRLSPGTYAVELSLPTPSGNGLPVSTTPDVLTLRPGEDAELHLSAILADEVIVDIETSLPMNRSTSCPLWLLEEDVLAGIWVSDSQGVVVAEIDSRCSDGRIYLQPGDYTLCGRVLQGPDERELASGCQQLGVAGSASHQRVTLDLR